ncbi:cytochrome P450 3A24-like [Oppia nitens]|uniref:cytochrome P450 3A24-like n=1 Tax=Oppia nitens TaxID=1686743 RepID=UPI0023DB2A2B|nr:cytochrome P450 3A24-like [Oppia nitens]
MSHKTHWSTVTLTTWSTDQGQRSKVRGQRSHVQDQGHLSKVKVTCPRSSHVQGQGHLSKVVTYTRSMSSITGNRVLCTHANGTCWRPDVPTASVGLWTRMTRHGHEWEQDLYRRYGKCFGVYELNRPVLYLSDPVLIRDVLVKDFHSFVNRESFYTGYDPLVDNIVGNLRGDQWKRVRSLMSTTFTTGKLKRMMPLIGECLQTMDKKLRTVSAAGAAANTTDGSSSLSPVETDMKQLYGAYSMEVIIQVAFGTKVDAVFDEDNPIIRNIQKFVSQDLNLRLLTIFLAPSVAKWLKLTIFDPKATKIFSDFTVKIIEDRRRQQQQQQQELKTGYNITEKRVDFLQFMLDSISVTTTDDNIDITDGLADNHENYGQLSIAELVSQCLVFLSGGYETTTNALSIASYLLAKNPEVQEKLFKEVDNYYKHNNVDYDILNSLKYLDAVIMESMRIYPSASFLERQASDDYTLGGGGSTGTGGIQIKKGQQIKIPIYAMQHDEANFPNADQFLPERFLADNVHKHDPYVFMPFGARPRNCVGLRLGQMFVKLALVYTVYQYRFIDTGKPIEFYNSLGSMTPKNVMVRVEKRP